VKVKEMANRVQPITGTGWILMVAAAMATLFILLTDRWTYFVSEQRDFLFVHSILEMICIAISFSIAIQGWLTLPHTMSRQSTLVGAVFLGIGILDTIHVLTYQGMPLYVNAPGSATWLWSLSRLGESIGLLCAFAMPDRLSGRWFRGIAYTISLLAAVSIILFVFGLLPILPPLTIEGKGVTPLKQILELAGIGMKLMTIALLILKYRASIRFEALMKSFLTLVLGGFMFMVYRNVNDSYSLYGHMFKMIGFFWFLKGIYMVTVQEPFLKQKQTEAQLFEHQQQIQESEIRYKHLALHDELTGLPNRRWFMEALDSALNSANQSRVALLLFDIDRFKSINDTMGHKFGDSLLRAVAVKLERFSAQRGILARLGGDEFAILLPMNAGPAEIRQYGHLLMEELGAPCRIDDQEFRMSGSIGIARYPGDSDSPEAMLKHAEIAMYRAKERRSKVEWYTSDMEPNQEAVAMEHELRQAIERDEFVLYYQPRVAIGSQAVTGVEALIRWNHPRRGFIPPSQFIPVAEETGMIVPIGEWVLREACAQWSQWRQSGLEPPSIAVNLSSVQFNEGKLVEAIARILADSSIPPGVLVLEITESIAMDIGLAMAKINQLKALGLAIDIDDFGTGYSSLSYLKRLPIDRLKIDRSFVRDLSTDPSDAAIIASITAMAHHLNITVVAEGVETEEQLAYLKDHHCDEAQGFWFSPPVPAQAFAEYMIRMRKGNIHDPGNHGMR